MAFAAAPTFMGIPPECRQKILRFVLEEEKGTVSLDKNEQGEYYDECKNIPHPLLLVSRTVYAEATPYYSVTLRIRRDFRDIDQKSLVPEQPASLCSSVKHLRLESRDAVLQATNITTMFPNIASIRIKGGVYVIDGFTINTDQLQTKYYPAQLSTTGISQGHRMFEESELKNIGIRCWTETQEHRWPVVTNFMDENPKIRVLRRIRF